MVICRTADVKDFLRAVQTHIYNYGIFCKCISDLGSSIVAGANTIRAFMSDPETKSFFDSNGIQSLDFDQYPKGQSSLGSMIEICVKQTKLLIHKAIKTLILDYFDFELLIHKTKSIINKRPITFQSSLRSLSHDEIPTVITPEMLVHGYDTKCLNVVPDLQSYRDEDSSPDYCEHEYARYRYSNLCKAKDRLIDLYHSDFLTTLIHQAVDKTDRYRKVNHEKLHVGDIVLLVEKNSKRYVYPMGRVVGIVENEGGETTAAHVVKGDTKERVFRHVNSLILLIPCGSDEEPQKTSNSYNNAPQVTPLEMSRPSRNAAKVCRERLAAIAEQA